MKERILVVEPHRDMARLFAKSWLPALGFDVLIAHSYTQSRALLAEQPVDLILLEIHLPDSTQMDHVAALRRDFATVPIILMTAHGSEQIAVEGFRLGARNYLRKPFTVERLQQALEDALREQRLLKEKEQLAEGLRQRVQELTVLHAVGRSITTVKDLDELLKQIVEAAIHLSQAEEGFLLLSDGNQLTVRAAKNIGDARVQVLQLPVKDSLAGQVMRTRQPIRLNRPHAAQQVKLKTGYLVRSLLLVPLIAQTQTLGVLGVDNVVDSSAFSDTHERLLAALADYAAIALENTRLLQTSQRSETRYRELFTNAHDVFIVLDHDLCITEINAAGPQMLDYPQELIVGQRLGSFTLPERWPAIEAHLRLCAQGQAPTVPFELTLCKRNGGRIKVEMTVRIMPDIDGQPALFCSLRDLTERLMLQAQMAHADKLAALEHVVAGVAHELNNPLTGIIGYSQLLLRDENLSPQTREDIERMFEQGQQASRIVQGMLMFSRGSLLSRTTVDMNALIDTTLEQHLSSETLINIAIVRDLQPQIPSILADPAQMQQVLQHLLNNARRAMEQSGGVLTIRSYAVDDIADLSFDDPTSPLPTNMRGPAVMIEIKDTGVGIVAHELRSIFDPFWTTKETGQGPGLGLSVSHGMIAQHRGHIWASSVAGRGTTVYLALPPKSALLKQL
ncbi:MAG: GAF domain-containing protein [Chloroflexi bacterium]|nr:GAF domain-containing protein [Chloroflexota bacterium]